MAKRNPVQRAFDAFGSERFQSKRSGCWIRSASGVEQRLNLQKSDHGQGYYLNFSLDFTAAVPENLRYDESDQGQSFAVEGRIDDFLSDSEYGQLRDLLDVEGVAMEGEHREHALLALLERNLSALDDVSTLDGIASYHRAGRLEGFLETRAARRVLDALTT